MRIIWKNPDGSVAISTPVNTNLSLEEVIEQTKKELGDVELVDVVPVEEIPQDRTFRNAWTTNGGNKIKVDMPLAREVWRNKIRKAREPKLAALDIEFTKALEKADAKGQKDVASARQKLRDLTALPEIEAAETPEALKAIWPKELE